ncbi:hypothetical protein [Adhaeribacter soli]|uniref:Uncharacterized protein n=1 Tax=Adhaeribacter soli TaxID=2607655 RepID=A0A5N1J4R1_9BACT|nr:hypothetical protein [Adhaeribacter soli]KAA9345891.1 hypothetical protein F0P94_02070 [Adhaeribacter soli]
MNKKRYIDYIILKLLEHFPDIADNLKLKSGNNSDIELSSKRGKIKLLIFIVEDENEVTVGFQAGEEQFGWHVHMDMFGAKNIEEMINVAIELVKEIISDQQVIIYTSDFGYFISGTEQQLKELQEEEGVEFYYWSEL